MRYRLQYQLITGFGEHSVYSADEATEAFQRLRAAGADNIQIINDRGLVIPVLDLPRAPDAGRAVRQE